MINRYKSSAILRDSAKGYMNGFYGRAIAVLMMFLMFNYGGNLLLNYIKTFLLNIFVSANITSLGALFALYIISGIIEGLVSVILSVLLIGIYLFYLKVGSKVMPAASDLYAGFREDFGRGFKTALGVKGPVVLALLPFNCLISYYIDSKNNAVIVPCIVSAIVGIAFYIFWNLSFDISYFIFSDFAEYSAIDVLKASWKKMKGHRGRLFALEISFIPYYLLAMLTFGIGLLWVMPFVYEARAQFYLDLMNPKKVSGKWERTA